MGLIDWMTANPKLSLILISIGVTLVMTLITKKFTNQVRMKELKQIQKDFNKKMKENSGNPEVIMQIQKEVMNVSMEMMRHSFKPMLITFLPLIILFWWIRGIYSGILDHWIWYYIVASIISSIIFRKIFDVA